MRGFHRVFVWCAVMLLAGSACARSAGPAAHAVAAAAHRAPAPANPDFSAFIQRYYDNIETRHWRFAYAMFSPGYRARSSEAEVERRYAAFADLNVAARQSSDRTVRAVLDARERSGTVQHLEERITLAWDGEEWTIDSIDRRDVSPRMR